MKLLNFAPLSMAAAMGSLVACGAPEQSDDTGSIEFALTVVPADVSCVRLVATGSRTVTSLRNVSPGASSAGFNVDRLPAGIVQVDGQAFRGACSTVSSSSIPSYVTEAPVNVRVAPFEVAKVLLKLIRNGRLSVGVDFEDPFWINRSTAPVDLAVFGDAPYGAVQISDFPNFIASINADKSIAEAVHLGDIKNGSSRCDTSYFQFVLDGLNTVKRPLLYTPGDNEWTDCHRANNGAFDPLERLATLRSMYYPVPGLSLGVQMTQVLSQSTFPGFETFVENQMWVEADTVFSVLHVVGSNNNLLPWFTDDKTGTKMDDPARRIAEADARIAATLNWLDRAFETAASEGSGAVVLMMQADIWEGAAASGFTAIVQKLAARTIAFGKPVLLLQGDSHIFKVDNPLAMGDAGYGVTTPVPNLTRVVVQGSTTAALTEWLKLHVDTAVSPPFSWTRITH